MAQAPAEFDEVPGLPQSSELKNLILAASDADTDEGLQDYSRSVLRMFVPARLGDAYLSALSDRIALADRMVRHDKRPRIPESSIADAFNQLMKQVAPRPDQAVQTSTTTAHKMRISLFNTSPSLSSVETYPTECLPTEAVLTLWLLLLNNGMVTPASQPRRAASPPGGYVTVAGNTTNARSVLTAYLMSHSRHDGVELYERVNHILGF